MKAIACAIMFAALWHTPQSLFETFTPAAKAVVSLTAMCALMGVLLGLVLEDNK
jgi:hypothetical protein